MWKLSIEDDQGNKTVVSLVRDEYAIGRAEENTVRLTERNISRRHAKLQRNGATWIVEDLASYNGCFVNGVRVSEPQPLEHGDLVQLGDYRLEIVDEQVAQAAFKSTVPSIPKAHSLLSQPDRLVMLAGPTPGAEFPLAGQRVVIGRGEECDVPINHASVSRVHAEIQPLGDGRYELVDRESANGIRVNGVDLKRSLLDARDTIELGDVVLKFIPAGQVYAAGSEAQSQMAMVAAPASFERATPTPGVGVDGAGKSPGIPPILKAVAGLAFVGVLVMIGMVAFGSRTREGEVAVQPNDTAAAILEEAKQLVQNGDVEGAHAKITSEIPEDSNARQTSDFREIEARWADMLSELAKNESDVAKKRALLERIAKATSVDSARRKTASNAIAELDKGVDPDSLPSSPQVPTATASNEPAAKKDPLKGGIVRHDPFESKAAPKPTAPTTAKPKASAPDTSAQDKENATSGDRAKLTPLKNALKGKVASGNATDADKRLLRGLCRQLGDMSCIN